MVGKEHWLKDSNAIQINCAPVLHNSVLRKYWVRSRVWDIERACTFGVTKADWRIFARTNERNTGGESKRVSQANYVVFVMQAAGHRARRVVHSAAHSWHNLLVQVYSICTYFAA